LHRVTKFAAAMVAGALALTACGGSSTTASKPAASGKSTSAAAPKSTLKVGMAYDIGGRGDQSFNDAAAAGLDKAKAQLGITAQEAEASQGESDSAKEARLNALASAGFNPIIAVGFAYSAAVAKVAKALPNTRFAIIDDAAAVGPNIANLTFAEEQGSFLVGAAAGLKTKTGNVGFIGGVDVPLIHKFEAGFKAGVQAAKPGTKVQVKYLTQPPDFSGFGNPAKGKTAAAGMYDNGADIVYAAAGGSGGGVFEAAKAAKALAIGVDSDQYNTADPSVKDVILTSALKKVDVAVFDFITSVNDNKFVAGQKVYDLKAGGVGYATSGGKVDDIKDKLEGYKASIISGEIVVPTK
jgi:basic membrane protein A and related proteins